jgi:UDP-N-acetylglucosamine--N-acetylmuramyl-(pentapeptide) pyrophosphoryl-undecaprenol N-acetylglucosamine transferase
MKSPKKILFTGGGSAGHVVKNLILLEEIKKLYPDVKRYYIGSRTGFERKLVTKEKALLHVVPTGKLRRYFSLRTIPDFFSFCAGTLLATLKLLVILPNVVFSSGGYVALPTALAAWILGIPVVTHETDTVAGLANRMIARVATKVCVGFEQVIGDFNPLPCHCEEEERRRGKLPVHRSLGGVGGGASGGVCGKCNSTFVFTGNPVRREIYEAAQAVGTGLGLSDKGRSSTNREQSRHGVTLPKGISTDKKTVLIVGGSQGAQQINKLVLEILPQLTKKYQVIHQVGKGKKVDFEHEAYRQFEYLGDSYADSLAAADCVVTRGGGTLTEVYQLGKPTVVIPLSSSAGGHQMKNAQAMAKDSDLFVVLDETKANDDEMLAAIEGRLGFAGGQVKKEEATGKIMEVLKPYLTMEK